MNDEIREAFEKGSIIPLNIYWNEDHYSGRTSLDRDNQLSKVYNEKLKSYKEGIESLQPEIEDWSNSVDGFVMLVKDQSDKIDILEKLAEQRLHIGQEYKEKLLSILEMVTTLQVGYDKLNNQFDKLDDGTKRLLEDIEKLGEE